MSIREDIQTVFAKILLLCFLSCCINVLPSQLSFLCCELF
jgi:hypothetical protein